ncbi:hypothetical protein ACFL20_13620, partial [Spirochaetota bacterium]
IYADLLIDGKKVSPGVKVMKREYLDVLLPKTKRKISLRGFDVRKHLVEIYIEPGKQTVIPPDTVMVNLSLKRLIWVVWLGTILIALGGLVSMRRVMKNRNS